MVIVVRLRRKPYSCLEMEHVVMFIVGVNPSSFLFIMLWFETHLGGGLDLLELIYIISTINRGRSFAAVGK
jgi:hypothetical protein